MERLRGLRLFSPEKRRLQGRLLWPFRGKKGPVRKVGTNFLAGTDAVVRGDGLKLKAGQFTLD